MEVIVNKNVIYSNIILGIISIVLSIIIFFLANQPIYWFIVLFSCALLLSGINCTIHASSHEDMMATIALLKFVIGLITLLLSTILIFITIYSPVEKTSGLLFGMLSLILGLMGSIWIFFSLANKNPFWYRIIVGSMGLVNLILVTIILFQLLIISQLALTMFLTIWLILNGCARIILALIGWQQSEN